MPRHSDTAGGVDLTIYSSEGSAFVPGRTFVNGREVFIPEGSEMELENLTSTTVSTVTLTMFVRSLQLLPAPLMQVFGESDE